jgi:hypothetical protein
MVTFLLLLAGFICFVLTAFGVASRVNLVAVGLALWILVPLIDAFAAVM